VAEPLLRDLGVHPAGEKMRCVTMPQVVKTDSRRRRRKRKDPGELMRQAVWLKGGCHLLRPRTTSGIAAVAATLKGDGLDDYWAEPNKDPDWTKVLITRFLDALIAGGPRHTHTDADRTPA
jgi:hypothetical protein